jgi:hypothetical protein
VNTGVDGKLSIGTPHGWKKHEKKSSLHRMWTVLAP